MTAIEWTDRTWNPVRGCSKVSPGCTNCYAERTAARQAHTGYAGLVRIGDGSPRRTGEVRLVADKLREPLSWRTPARVFVNSMSDLFHEKLTTEDIASVFAAMERAPRHTSRACCARTSSDPSTTRRGSARRPASRGAAGRKGGDPDEWPQDLRVRQFPEVPHV